MSLQLAYHLKSGKGEDEKKQFWNDIVLLQNKKHPIKTFVTHTHTGKMYFS